jgi:hypothetical protein
MLAELRAGLSGVRFLAVRKVFIPTTYRVAIGPNQPPIQWVLWILSQGVMFVMICRQRPAAAVRISEHGVRTAVLIVEQIPCLLLEMLTTN